MIFSRSVLCNVLLKQVMHAFFFDISDLLTSLRLQLHLAVCESVNYNLIREETVKLLWISWTGMDVDLICTTVVIVNIVVLADAYHDGNIN